MQPLPLLDAVRICESEKKRGNADTGGAFPLHRAMLARESCDRINLLPGTSITLAIAEGDPLSGQFLLRSHRWKKSSKPRPQPPKGGS